MNGTNRRVFVDANVLLYARDGRDAAKQTRAEAWMLALWSTGAGRLSWQVLHEFYWNAVRKLRLDPALVRESVNVLAEWQPVDTSLGMIQQAWGWVDTTGIPYWDALIVAAAERSGAAFLLSEDFQAGRVFRDCAVVNPFTTVPEGLLR